MNSCSSRNRPSPRWKSDRRKANRRGNAAMEAVMVMVFLLGAFAFLGWATYWMYRESFLIILTWQHLPY